jgi:hypothetical protein
MDQFVIDQEVLGGLNSLIATLASVQEPTIDEAADSRCDCISCSDCSGSCASSCSGCCTGANY